MTLPYQGSLITRERNNYLSAYFNVRFAGEKFLSFPLHPFFFPNWTFRLGGSLRKFFGVSFPLGPILLPQPPPPPTPVGWFVFFESLLCPLTSDPLPGGRAENRCSLCFWKQQQQQAMPGQVPSKGREICPTRKTPGYGQLPTLRNGAKNWCVTSFQQW